LVIDRFEPIELMLPSLATCINGNFTKSLQAPALSGSYGITMTVTDETFTGTRESVFSVTTATAPGATPPAPPSPPTKSGAGVWTYSSGVGGVGGSWVWNWITPPATARVGAISPSVIAHFEAK
jgi:hypothetical protein